MRGLLRIAVAAIAVLLAGCHDNTTLSTTPNSTGVSSGASMGDSAPVPSNASAPTIAPTSVAVATDGVPFTDPQGAYTIDVAPTWTRTTRTSSQEVEGWTLEPARQSFTTNVTVLTQAAPGLDLAAYLDASVADMGGFELIDHRTVAGSNGNDLGVLEYTGFMTDAEVSRPLHFLAIIDVADDRAVVATLTAEESSFAQWRAQVEPYLLTLTAT